MRFFTRIIAHAARTFTQRFMVTGNAAVYKVEKYLGTDKFRLPR
jgi:hypothetical protein